VAALAVAVVAAWLVLGSEAPGGGSRPAGPVSPSGAGLAAGIQASLDARARALLAGDERGWLAGLDSGRRLRAGQRRLYRNLRNLSVADYSFRLRDVERSGGRVRATVAVGYCFGDPRCDAAESEAMVVFQRRGDRMLMLDYTPVGQIRPWEVSRLEVSVGRRVIVAAQPGHADLADTVRARADRVARHADRFGPLDGTRFRHLIFVGSPEADSVDWYGKGLRDVDTAASYRLTPRGDYRILAVEHVVRGDRAGGLSLSLLGWHLALGAASIGASEPHLSARQLGVGIAEYVAAGFSGSGGGPPARPLRAVLKTWDGDLERFYPGGRGDPAAWQVVSRVVVDRLIDRYTTARFIAFYDALARHDVDLEKVAPERLGAPLAQVEADLVGHLRGLASAG
jgi:hypothetical protein